MEVDVFTDSGAMGRAAVPSGASTGEHEAVELRDGGAEFLGKGVEKAVENVREIIAPEIIGLPVTQQNLIDQIMIEADGTKNKRGNSGLMLFLVFLWQWQEPQRRTLECLFINMWVV